MSEVKSTTEACYDARIALIKERDELARQVSELQLSQQNIINAFGIKGDGPWSKLVIEYVMGLVAENVALKDSREILAKNALETCNEVYSAGYRNTALHDGLMESTGDRNRYPSPIRALVSESIRSMETPNTDAFTAELRAQGLDAFAESVAEMHSKTEIGSRLEVQLAFTGDAAVSFAANLRAGRKG